MSRSRVAQNRGRAAGPAYLLFLTLIVLMLLGAALFAYYSTFTAPLAHDDEGYLMISVKLFNEGRALYDAVFSQYGPFYYLYHWLVYGVLRAPVSHDATRFITVVHWLAIASLAGLLVHRLTRLPLLGCLTFLQTAYHLGTLRNEPGHPHGVALLLIALSLYLATYLRHEGRGVTKLAVLGGLLGALTLVKVNTGTFSFVALALTLLLFARRNRSTRTAALLAAACAVALPGLLMWRHLRPPDAQTASSAHYCAVATLSALALAVVAFAKAPRGELTLRHFAAPALGFLGVSVGTCLFTLARGTTFPGLLDGLLFRPLRFSDVFYVPAGIAWSATLLGLVSLGLAAGYALQERPFGIERRRFIQGLSWLKIVLGALLIGLSLKFRPLGMVAYCTPFLWLLLTPGPGDYAAGSHNAVVRTLLALTAALQALQAYPVCGTQQSLAALLLVLAGVLLLWDGARAQEPIARRVFRSSVARRRLFRAGALAVLLLAYASLTSLLGLREQYRASTPLGLPGAARVRLPAEEVAELNWATNALRVHADTFLTLPGLNSFYFWAEKEPPTGLNTTTWMTLLTDKEQQEVLDALSRHERACILCNASELRFWAGHSKQAPAPVFKHIKENYKPVLSRGEYSLLVRKARTLRDSSRRSNGH